MRCCGEATKLSVKGCLKMNTCGFVYLAEVVLTGISKDPVVTV